MAGEIRLVLADDHPLLRKGLRQTIEADPKFVVLAEAGDGEAALQQIDQLRPDIAVLDVDMPKLDGLAVASEIQKRKLPVHVVFLTMHAKADLFYAAMDLGARGYILKDSVIFEIVNGLLAVVAGQHYVSPPLTTHLLNRTQKLSAFASSASGFASLTNAERRILR